MTAKRNTRRQTAAEKRQSDINLIRNAITAMENFISKYPNDPYIEGRVRQLNQQREKLAAMGA